MVDIERFLHRCRIHVEIVDVEHLENQIVDELSSVRIEPILRQKQVNRGLVHENEEILGGR
jgi:hypothetical protein